MAEAKQEYLFFFCRAPRDESDQMRMFFRDLAERSGQGFYDETPTEEGWFQGPEWDALHNSRVLVCMYSPAFFESKRCQRAIELFSNRGEGSSRRILPLVWMPSPETSPPVAA